MISSNIYITHTLFTCEFQAKPCAYILAIKGLVEWSCLKNAHISEDSYLHFFEFSNIISLMIIWLVKLATNLSISYAYVQLYPTQWYEVANIKRGQQTTPIRYLFFIKKSTFQILPTWLYMANMIKCHAKTWYRCSLQLPHSYIKREWHFIKYYTTV